MRVLSSLLMLIVYGSDVGSVELEPDPILPANRLLEHVEWADALSYGIFTTRTTYNGNLGGLGGAYQKCRDAAASQFGEVLTTDALIFGGNNHPRFFARFHYKLRRLRDGFVIGTYGNYAKGETLRGAIDPRAAAPYAFSGAHHRSPSPQSYGGGNCNIWTNSTNSYMRSVHVKTTHNMYNRGGGCRDSRVLICRTPLGNR